MPFTDQEIATIWEHSNDNEVLQAILIMIYSGFRISAYSKLEVNMQDRYFRGGVKTTAGKNRIVPFNKEIIPLIREDNILFHASTAKLREAFYEELKKSK